MINNNLYYYNNSNKQILINTNKYNKILNLNLSLIAIFLSIVTLISNELQKNFKKCLTSLFKNEIKDISFLFKYIHNTYSINFHSDSYLFAVHSTSSHLILYPGNKIEKFVKKKKKNETVQFLLSSIHKIGQV